MPIIVGLIFVRVRLLKRMMVLEWLFGGIYHVRSREGYKVNGDPESSKRRRDTDRCGCPAMIAFKLNGNLRLYRSDSTQA